MTDLTNEEQFKDVDELPSKSYTTIKQFYPGDQVKIKNGNKNVQMIVGRINSQRNEVECLWYTEDRKLQKEWIFWKILVPWRSRTLRRI